MAVLYVEYRTDDARLTMGILKSAVNKGAYSLECSKVGSLLYNEGRLTGSVVNDQLPEEE